jgi:cation transport protein ChaC
VATLAGWKRAFCRLSFRHRGTESAPGMVVGLESGGECRGYAYLIAPEHEAEVLAYLDEREGAGYRRIKLPLVIEGTGGPFQDESWVYVPEQDHPSYAAGLPRERVVELIAKGRGQSGTAHNYLVALLGELERIGAADAELRGLLQAVEAYRREHGAPPRPAGAAPAAERVSP